MSAAALGCDEPEVPVWGQLPDFELADQDAAAFGSEQLRGTVWVADFIFTSCPGRCPMLTREMARLQRQLRAATLDDVTLVSISVDPETDTPAALSEYAKKHGADRGRWRFLTGERQKIWELSAKGFLLPVAEGEGVGGGPILHSNKFVLADRTGRIRGYYDAFDDDARAKLLRDIERVRAEPATAS
jgi:protein SCO1/2